MSSSNYIHPVPESAKRHRGESVSQKRPISQSDGKDSESMFVSSVLSSSAHYHNGKNHNDSYRTNRHYGTN
jgi:hypothetical protein